METTVTSRQVPFFAGRYRCEAYLGGGMADVYRARDTELPRDVAIKILKPESLHDPDIRAAFLDEVQLASRCSHENIVMTYDKGDFGGAPYIVMEFLRGENLDSIIKDGRQGDLKKVLQTALQIARALEYVHAQSIVHRDLKPQNVHVDENGRVKLVDFGIAKSVEWNKTQAGLVKGTAYYMSPEQVMGEPITFQTDIWSFGVLLYEMLAGGKRPFQGSSLDTLWAAIVNGSPDYSLLTQRSIPGFVQEIVRTCLEKKTTDRFVSFSAVVFSLESALVALSLLDTPPQLGAPIRVPLMKRPTTWALIGALALAIACLGVLVYHVISDRQAAPQHLAKQISTTTGDMVLVEGGPAIIGSSSKQKVIKTFYIDKTEVSNAVYLRFITAKHWHKPKDFPEDKPNLPVVNVTLSDAIAFAHWAGKYIPSNDEWEKAARGPNGLPYPWGEKSNPELANIAGNPKITTPGLLPVDSFPLGHSPYGALNMCGNVWEWVDTDLNPDPEFLTQMELRLKRKFRHDDPFYAIRGGFFGTGLSSKLMTDAASFPAEMSDPYIGFRCAKHP